VIASLSLLLFSSSSLLHSNNIEYPQICNDDVGNSIAIWEDFSEYNSTIQVSSRVANGSWSSPKIISNPQLFSYHPVMVSNNQGDCVAVWLVKDPIWGNSGVVGRIKAHTSKTWSPITNLSTPYETVDQNMDIDIYLNDEGYIAIVWKSLRLPEETNIIMSVSGTIANGWEKAVEISEEI